jgi:hypothetical protein
VNRIHGLARLLVLEKLATTQSRQGYVDKRSQLRGRPVDFSAQFARSRQARKFHGDLKGDAAFSGLEMSDYDVTSLHIPYGPGWDAKRIAKLIYKTVSTPVPALRDDQLMAMLYCRTWG